VSPRTPQRPGLGLKQHRVPARLPLSVGPGAGGRLDGCGPLAALAARHPDADIGPALGAAAEPRRRKAALGLDDGRCVATREGGRLEDELRLLHRVVRRMQRGRQRRQHGGDAKGEFHWHGVCCPASGVPPIHRSECPRPTRHASRAGEKAREYKCHVPRTAHLDSAVLAWQIF
jgi:hypothetical protein